MAITQTLTTSFKAEILLAVHDLRASTGDVFKMALYSSLASINANTTAYTTEGEVTGTNYTAGGIALTNLGVTATADGASAGVGWTSFEDAEFPTVTLTARGALIYNSTPSANGVSGAALTNPSVCVLDFGGDKTAIAKTFKVVFPADTADSAIVKIT